MIKTTIQFMLISLLMNNTLNAQNNMEKKWFENEVFTSVEIIKYNSISDKGILSTAVINDTNIINTFVSRIKQIPVNGNEMRNFADNAEKISIFFSNIDNNDKKEIQIYGHQFKTPSTGFNSANNIESELYRDIDAILFPTYGKNLLLIPNLELKFKNFTIKYLGNTFVANLDKTNTSSINKFEIIDKHRNKQIVDIESGQIPPQPYEIKISGKKILILTYEGIDSFRLYPTYFQIVKRKSKLFK